VPSLFLKQYGERRTGTNALRALVTANLPDIIVLMHILGDKHSPPQPLDDLWRDARQSDDPAWELVSRATFGAPSLTTVPGDRRQIAELRRCAAPLAAAWESGALGWLISIRNPYAWALSLARYLGWASRRVFPDGRIEDLRTACRRFNENYAAWLALLDADPRRTVLVRHEDLVGDPEGIVRDIGTRFGRQPRAAFEAVDRIVEPALWDGMEMPMRLLPYDRDHYAGDEHVRALPQLHRDVVTQTIDWNLLGRLGYAPLEG
jgi:hypothetical protein